MRKHVLLYGLLGGVLIAELKLIEYRWLVLEHSVEIYGALVAAVFASVGIWLGLRLTRKETVVVREVLVPAPVNFERDQGKRRMRWSGREGPEPPKRSSRSDSRRWRSSGR